MTLLCCCFSNFCEWFLASGFKVQSLAFNSLHRATIKTTKPFKFYRSKKSQIRSSNLGSPHHAAWSHTRTYSRSKSLSFAGNRMNGVSAAYCKTSIPSQPFIFYIPRRWSRQFKLALKFLMTRALLKEIFLGGPKIPKYFLSLLKNFKTFFRVSKNSKIFFTIFSWWNVLDFLWNF